MATVSEWLLCTSSSNPRPLRNQTWIRILLSWTCKASFSQLRILSSLSSFPTPAWFHTLVFSAYWPCQSGVWQCLEWRPNKYRKLWSSTHVSYRLGPVIFRCMQDYPNQNSNILLCLCLQEAIKDKWYGYPPTLCSLITHSNLSPVPLPRIQADFSDQLVIGYPAHKTNC